MTTLNGIKLELCRSGSVKHKKFGSTQQYTKQTAVVKKKSAAKSADHLQQQQYSTLIYSCLLQLVIATLKLVRFVQVQCLRMAYYVANEFVVFGSSKAAFSSSLCSHLTAPNHVCVILNEQVRDEAALERKCELVFDMMCSHGTRVVSFYCSAAVEQYVCELKQNLIDKYSNKFDKNNDSKCVQVNFFTSSQAGKNLLVDTCKQLATKVKAKELQAKDISQSLVDKSILELSNLPEPELIILIGEEDTLAGFSPWHIRLSEIIKIQSYTLINKFTIYKILNKYNKIEKRFGK